MVMVPWLMPPVMVAFEPKRVFPEPESAAKVIVPVIPLKYRASVAVFALVIAPTENPVPEIVAVPLALRARVPLEL
jgi:hypothetical protein